jgi:hypothetical protein
MKSTSLSYKIKKMLSILKNLVVELFENISNKIFPKNEYTVMKESQYYTNDALGLDESIPIRIYQRESSSDSFGEGRSIPDISEIRGHGTIYSRTEQETEQVHEEHEGIDVD